MITRQHVSEKLLAYLNDEITLAQLVDWAESCLVAGGFGPDDADLGHVPGVHAQAWHPSQGCHGLGGIMLPTPTVFPAPARFHARAR